MRKYIFLLCLLSIIAHSSLSQKSLKALKYIDKDELQKAFQALEKGLLKQAGDASNYYVLATLYSHSDFTDHFIDSAHYYVLKADTSFSALSSKERRKYARKGMDSIGLQHLHARIDSASFFQRKNIHTEDAYNFYINYYPQGVFIEQAIRLRDEVAYETALQQKTAEALAAFFRKYPEAPQAAEAREVFENLYFQQQVESKTLAAYQAYVAERPHTIFAEKAVSKLLDIISTRGDVEAIADFIAAYPSYKATKLAEDFLDQFHSRGQDYRILSHFDRGAHYFFNFETTSLENMTLKGVATDSCKWLNRPIYFINRGNEELILNRKGDTLFTGLTSEVAILDNQWLKLKQVGAYQYSLIHLSGNDALTRKANDFSVINGSFIASKELEGWYLRSFTGLALLSSPIDSIWVENNLIFFKKEQRFSVAKTGDFEQDTLGQTKALPFIYSDYEMLNDSLIWLSSDNFETIVDTGLNPKIALQQARISKEDDYFLIKNDEYTSCFDKEFNLLWSARIEQWQVKGKKLAIKEGGLWAFQDWKADIVPRFVYDSVRIFDPWLAFTERSNEKRLIFASFDDFNLEPNSSFKLLNASNLVAEARSQVKYVLINQEDKHQILLNQNGQIVWEGESQEIRVVSAQEVYVKSKNKQFIINASGKIFPLANVDAVGNYEEGMLHLLKDRKFGAYIIAKDQMLKAISEKKIKVYQKDSIFTYEEKGLAGLMNTKAVVLAANYSSIERVNDGVALVLQQSAWQLIHLDRPEEVLEQFTYVRPFYLGGTKYFEVRKSTGFGILSSQATMLVPPIYNNIELISHHDKYFWIAERNLAEINYRVLVYYNDSGEVLFKNGFDDEAFLKNSCD